MSLRPIVRARFLAYTGRLEGIIRCMYQDSIGKITVAYGCLCDPIGMALTLPLRWPDGRFATRAEIAAEWTKLKETPGLAKAGWPEAAKVSPLRLSPEDVERVTWKRLDEEHVPHLEKRFAAMPRWPASVQLAVVSLSWACGPGFDYPKLEAFLKAGDWASASTECKISHPDNPPRSAAQKALFLQAAAGGDPDALTLPWEAPPPVSPAFTALDREALLADLSASLADSAEDQARRDRDDYYRRQEESG